MRVTPGMLAPENWLCRTCMSAPGYLEWELIHGHCSCKQCGHPYMIREKGQVQDCLKSEFKAAAELGWQEGNNMRTRSKKEWERLQKETDNV